MTNYFFAEYYYMYNTNAGLVYKIIHDCRLDRSDWILENDQCRYRS